MPHRPPPCRWLAALIAASLTGAARAGEVEVQVPGFGSVPLADATRTCLDDKPTGALAAVPSHDRKAAFQEVAEGLLELSADERQRYFRYQEQLQWPRDTADASYVGDISWVPPGIVTSCYAVGAYWVRRAREMAERCQASKTECRALFTEGEWELAKEAYRQSRRSSSQKRDALFRALEDSGIEFGGYRDPQPFLDRACNYPQAASSEGRFVDTDDLHAARWACLQQLVLVTRSELIDVEFQTCETDWEHLPTDAAKVVVYQPSDLGVANRYWEEQLDRVKDRLTRMDPHPQTCAADWAMLWRRELVVIWRLAQEQRACDDVTLPVEDRALLCEDLLPREARRCNEGDGSACHVVAQMLLGGIGVEAPDETRGIEMLATACRAQVGAACSDILPYADTVAARITDEVAIAVPVQDVVVRIEAVGGGTLEGLPKPVEPKIPEGAHEALDRALAVLEDYALVFGVTWTKQHAQELLAAALTVRHEALAGALLARYGEHVSEELAEATAEERRAAGATPPSDEATPTEATPTEVTPNEATPADAARTDPPDPR